MRHLKKYVRSLEKKAEYFQKREEIYNIETLFMCYIAYICLHIVNHFLPFAIYTELSRDYSAMLIPSGLGLSFLLGLIILKKKTLSIAFPKEYHSKYIFYFDILKAGVFVILSIIIIEGKMLQASFRKDLGIYSGFWISFDFGLLTLLAVLTVQTIFVKISIIAFQIFYSYLRLEGWDNEIIDATFFFIKIIPVLLCLYKLHLFKERVGLEKSKQAENRKFASKVLDLLPEGVAIVDENGLRYHNNSLTTILRTNDNQCLSILSHLKNSEYDENQNAIPKRCFTLGNELNKHGTLGKGSLRTPKNRLFPKRKEKPSKASLEEIFKETVYPRRRRGKSRTFKSVQGEAIMIPVGQTGSYSPSLLKPQNHSIGALREQKNSKQNLKPSLNDQLLSNEKEKSERESTAILIPKEEKPSSKKAIPKPRTSKIKLRLKHLLDMIEQPYNKSKHKNVGDAIKELLHNLKVQFPTNELTSQFANEPKNISVEAFQKFISRSASFQNDKRRSRKKSLFYTLSQWATIMNSERLSENGVFQRLEIKFTPVFVNAKPSLIILIRDVTDREIIKQMEEKERSQSQALAAVSHEFRTPLNGILGMLDTLKDQISNEVCQNYLMPAYNSAKLLMTLVNDILDFHQIREQKIVLVPTQFNLRSKIEDCLSLISIQAKRRGLQIKLLIDRDVPKYINNDPNRLQQVVNNLLGNAIKFTLDGSITVKIETYSENKLTIKVIDTGIGIEPNNIQKLFKTFGKIDSKRNRELNPQGVGLGLTISNSIAELLCSDSRISGLNVISEYGHGSTFWFVLDNIMSETCESCELDEDNDKALFENIVELNSRIPAKVSSQINNTRLLTSFSDKLTDMRLPNFSSNYYLNVRSITEETTPGKRFLNSETHLLLNQGNLLKHLFAQYKAQKNHSPIILVVDDNDINQLVFQNFLKSFDVVVESAYNGNQALQKIVQRELSSPSQQYCLVFMDNEMPSMGGIECAKEITKLFETNQVTRFPIISQSGHDDQSEIEKSLQAGMCDYLKKPVIKNKLFEVILKWLNQQESHI